MLQNYPDFYVALILPIIENLKRLGLIMNENKQDCLHVPLTTLNYVTYSSLDINIVVLIFLVGHDRQNSQLQIQASKGRK